MINWDKYKYHPPTSKPNKLNIPINNIGLNDDGVVEFNEIYNYCIDLENSGLLSRMKPTPSCGISFDSVRGACWMITVKKAFIEIIIRNFDAKFYRFIVGYGKEKKAAGISGRRAFQIYCNELKKDGVDIESMAIENGYEVKKTIPSPRIECVATLGRTYLECHHIDINSAFNAGMMTAFPALTTTVKRLYHLRKKHPYYKDVLNMTQGFMQSELVGYKYSHISKSGYVWTNEKINEISLQLQSSGRRIIGYNTDGIWYQGKIFHNEEEGTDIGQWKHDHVGCKLRYKSKGSYEYVDSDGVYHPVFRGVSKYENIKPRELWEWGDIFNADPIEFWFEAGRGLVSYDSI